MGPQWLGEIQPYVSIEHLPFVAFRFLISNHRTAADAHYSLPPPAPPGTATKVFVNGVWVGVHREPQQLVATLRALRRQLDINAEVRLLSHWYCL